jgi:hypothetical protein
MIIQFNAKDTKLSESFRNDLSAALEADLDNFMEHISRLEVHLSDENGKKHGPNDKRCLLEARLNGRKPIAVTDFANNYEQAVSGASTKLVNALTTVFGKLKTH